MEDWFGQVISNKELLPIQQVDALGDDLNNNNCTT
jgi:hypothetical protein